MPSTRRKLLAALGAGVAAGIAGCVGSLDPMAGPQEPKYRLTARRQGPSLADAFLWKERGPYSEIHRERLDDLLTEGTLTTVGFAIVHFDHPVYAARDGRYYRVEFERDGKVERERWLLWFDLFDGEPPADAAVVDVEDLPDDLTALDRHALEMAAGYVEAEFGPRDLEGEGPNSRGYVFSRRTPDETDLLPDPPFTHLRVESADGPRYARAVTERVRVSQRRFRYTATPVADARSDFERHVADEHLRTSFDAPSSDLRDVIDDVVAGGREERPPLSEGFQALLDRLGLADETFDEDDITVHFSDDVYFGYDGRFFSAQLELFRRP